MKVSEILQAKGSNVYAVPADTSVYEALKAMGEKNIGALLIMDGEKLLGIFSERDYARKIILKGKNSHETLVRDIMTENVISVTPEDNIDKCMELMSEKDKAFTRGEGRQGFWCDLYYRRSDCHYCHTKRNNFSFARLYFPVNGLA